jgi:hypothetical protein
MVTLDRNKGYRSTLGIRNEVGVTIEVFIFLRKGITKMETKSQVIEERFPTRQFTKISLK